MKIKVSKPTVLLGIDFQNDFMEGGSLAVPNANRDAYRFARFLSRNRKAIDKVIMSLDTHENNQIFHPSWWSNAQNEHPEPFTTITSQDVQNGVWKPLFSENESVEYLKGLEKEGKKALTIWPYHCLKGTKGASVNETIADVLAEFSSDEKDKVTYVEKGMNPISEMYGIVKPEYVANREDLSNQVLIDELMQYPVIIIGGEAKSHCVLESIHQITESFEERGHRNYMLYVLQDCMSSITGYEEETEEAFEKLRESYPVVLTESHNLIL